MRVIVCIDDNGGMLFNNRRQSRDKAVIKKIEKITEGAFLWVNEYSQGLFQGDVIVDDDLLVKAKEYDYCFIENIPLSEHIDSINTLYIFKWNRKYPYDFKLDIDFERLYHIDTTEDIVGNSHERITLEKWIR